MAQVICPSCRNPLDVPPALMGGPVRCANCMTVFTPTPEVPTVPVVLPRQSIVNRATPELEEPITKPSRIWLWVLLLGCTLITFTCLGSFAGIFGVMSNPAFKPFAANDGTYSAIFPGEAFPIVRSIPGREVSGVECQREIPAEERYFVEYYLLTDAEKAKDAQKAAAEAATQWISGQNGTLMEQDAVDHRGLPASQVFGQISMFKGNVAIRAMRDGDRMYVIGVSGGITPGNDRVVKFFDDFIPKGAPDQVAHHDDFPHPLPPRERKKNPFKGE